MRTVTLSNARSKLSGLVEKVNETRKEVLITRNGLPVAVLMSVTTFESWKETLDIKSDVSLMRDIKQGLVELENKKARLYSIEELLQ